MAHEMLITSSGNKDYMEANTINTLNPHKESNLTIWTLAWMGLWTGVVVCGFALFLH
jgi:hypothetical protein